MAAIITTLDPPTKTVPDDEAPSHIQDMPRLADVDLIYVFVVLGCESLRTVKLALDQIPADTIVAVFVAGSNRNLIEDCL